MGQMGADLQLMFQIHVSSVTMYYIVLPAGDVLQKQGWARNSEWIAKRPGLRCVDRACHLWRPRHVVRSGRAWASEGSRGMTRRRMSFLVVGVLLLVVAATRGLAVRPTPTGPLLWTMALDGFPQSIVVDAQTHRAFITTMPLGVGAGSARMSVLDTDTGAILRHIVIGGNGYPPPVVDERDGRVVVAASVLVRSGPGGAGIVS